jgi:hypothetical protein
VTRITQAQPCNSPASLSTPLSPSISQHPYIETEHLAMICMFILMHNNNNQTQMPSGL